MHILKEIWLRLLVFFLIPLLVPFIAGLLSLVIPVFLLAVLLSLPVFLPFVGYEFCPAYEPTPVIPVKAVWILNVLFCASISFLTALASRTKPFPVSVLCFIALVLPAAAIVHWMMYRYGFRYWVETP